jgi:hypothetical protein
MSKRILSGIYFSLLTCVFYFSVQAQTNGTVSSIVNTAHLDSLYEEVQVAGNTIGIIHIYSEYPDYKWVDDSDEGTACVDDAARAAIFYMEYFKAYDDESGLFKVKMLLEFIFYMQSDNGFFYNFIFEDYSINKDHKNSLAEPNWWGWRAMWALSEGYKLYKDIDPLFAELIFSHLSKAVYATKQMIPNETEFDVIDGIIFPTWLPGESAGDQASVLILALLNYLEVKTDTVALKYLNQLCDGILQMQKGDSASIPYYAFLSWQNIWHAYGNSQSYSLFRASSFLNREDLFNAAKNEINYFYDYLIQEKHLSYFSLGFDNDHFQFTDRQKFSQIAYNFRPIIYSCLEAFKITGDSLYAVKAGEIASWFFGNNAADEQIYFPSTGICYDGINSEDNVNNNSGAESTIEALLALLAVENNTISKNIINKIICKKYYETN